MPAPKKSAAARRPKRTKPKPDPVKIADMIVNQTEMAAILGITTRRLRQLEKEEHVVVPEGPGKFHVGKVVQAYVGYRAEGVAKKSGSESMDRLREEKALDIRLNRMRKDRDLISLEEALGTIDEMVGLFISSLTGLPAQITGVPRERQRLDDIFDAERQRLADSFAKKRSALTAGGEAADAETEDDAA